MSKRPAMTFRLSLPIPRDLDWQKGDVIVHCSLEHAGDVLQHVITHTDSTHPMNWLAVEDAAAAKWTEKYGEKMPFDSVEPIWLNQLSADAISYPGPTPLTEIERERVTRTTLYGDFTMDMLILMVEGLGWRPAQPVAEDDPGWVAVWAEEIACLGYLDAIRVALGMQERPDTSAMPLVVQRFYAAESMTGDPNCV